MEAAFMDTLMLLATLCSDDEILVDISSANLAGARTTEPATPFFARIFRLFRTCAREGTMI
jgi:hypothetical protein